VWVLAGLEELKVGLMELRVWLEELRVWLAEVAANPPALVGRSLCEGRSPSFCAPELNEFWESDPSGSSISSTVDGVNMALTILRVSSGVSRVVRQLARCLILGK
jgi:hypothetical protein